MTKTLYWHWFRIFLTIFIIILIPTYWHYYGLQNFLWLSDIGLFLTLIALWLNSVLIMSMAAVGIFILELVWAVDYFVELLFNINIIDLSDYMFDPQYPLILRAVSLFHVVTPVVWILYLKEYGYDRRALYYFTSFYWMVLTATYTLTDIKENINWVFLPQIYTKLAISQQAWLAFMVIGFPLLIFLPTHLVFRKIFKASHLRKGPIVR